MSSLIVTGNTQDNNMFTAQRLMYSLDMNFGAGGATSTPTIVYGDDTTYRFAVRLPNIGILHNLRVLYSAKTTGAATGTVDFRLFRAPFDATDFDPLWDRLYEKNAIPFGVIWEHNMSNSPIHFYNRLAYVGNDPNGSRVANPRNFLWMEIKPNDATVTVPIIKVNLFFEV
jgi:hypothetical protein